jgi:glycerophosphoryl diester phosphodiesterase
MKSESVWLRGAPLVIAHRGASAYAPENTLSAFRLALELGADALEVDVKLTRDRIAILMHDSSLARTTNGTGQVSNLNYADILQLEAGGWFDQKYAGESIPTLEGLLRHFGDRCLLNIELTNYSTPADSLPEIVNHLVSAARLEDKVLLSSFNPLNLIRIRRVNPQIHLGLLLHKAEPKWLRRLYQILIPHDFLHLQESLFLAGDMGEVSKANKRIHIWTVNQEERMHQFLLPPLVNGIITDVPDVARKVLSRIVDENQGECRQNG